MKAGSVLGLATTLAMGATACGSTPDATSERPSATAGGAPSASTARSAAAPVSSSSTAPAADPCADARKTVVAEAAKVGQCKTDADCKVHSIVLCNFAELDCHAAHVNKDSSTADLDQAVSAYVKSCSKSKCRCSMPTKSVCSNGKCARG